MKTSKYKVKRREDGALGDVRMVLPGGKTVLIKPAGSVDLELNEIQAAQLANDGFEVKKAAKKKSKAKAAEKAEE